MCNFIIRPIKCYATVQVSEGESASRTIKQGEALEVTSVGDGKVYAFANQEERDNPVAIALEVFVHTFSDKDPNKKEKKDSKDSKDLKESK